MNPRPSPKHLIFAALLLATLPNALPAQTPGWNWAPVAMTGTVPGARHFHAMAYDSQRGKTVLFGGVNNGSLFNDTWEWDGSTWAQVSLSGTVPGARHLHAMAYDSSRGKTVLFGGADGSYFGYLINDTWEWNGTTWAQVPMSGTVPAPRYGHTMAYDRQRGKTVLFGGVNGGTFFNDTWEWNGSGWGQVSMSGTVPGARLHHAMIYGAQSRQTVLFGGVNNGGVFNDTWEFNGNTSAQVSLSGAVPGLRFGHSMAYDSQRGKTVLFGGYNGNELSETWELTGPPPGLTADIAYTAIPTSATPAAVTGHALAALPTVGSLLFGGTIATLPQPFTYILDNTTWSKQFSLNNPMPRTDASLLLDPTRANNLLFGGRNPLGTALADTWTWQNSQWNYLPLAITPTPRSGHRMVFDRVANVGLLFGGKDSLGNARNDFWQWNGTAWSQLTPAALPPARSHHGFAYDERRQRAVLHGGIDGTTRIDDIWEWNGSVWTQITPSLSAGFPWTPGARSGHTMAYDPRSERVVVHGGDAANGCQQDVWSWDGTQWTLHTPTTAVPTARTGAALWHDPTANQLRLFGGGCGTSYTNDLWALSLPVNSRWSNYGQGCVGSLGTPTIAVVAPSAPIVGTTMNVRLTNIFGQFVPAFAAFGAQRDTFSGIPLPLDLTAVGLPSCWLQNSTDQILTLTPPTGGIVNWPISLPNNPQLLGSEFFLQGFCFEAPGYPRFGSMTDGLLLRLGDR